MPFSKEQRILLESLIEKYENSATFRGENKVRQRFAIKPENLFPQYVDEKKYDFFVSLNRDIREMEKENYISVSVIHMQITEVCLNVDKISEIYEKLGRRPKRDLLYDISEILSENMKSLEAAESFSPLSKALLRYAKEQQRRVSEGKFPEYYGDSIVEYKDFWSALLMLENIDDEIYMRDFSVRLFNDSKRLETLCGRISGCLFKYGDFPDKDKVLEEVGIVKTPSHVSICGPVELVFEGQTLNVGELDGDITLSTKTIKNLKDIRVKGNRIITVENLTSFYGDGYLDTDVLICLGGYHNSIKREFLKILYEKNPSKEYYHFGDMDAGGFYIYEHLREKTQIPFQAMNMSRTVLKKFENYAKKLTPNDERRIRLLMEKYKKNEIRNPQKEEIIETLSYMLSRGIKLEQEAIMA